MLTLINSDVILSTPYDLKSLYLTTKKNPQQKQRVPQSVENCTLAIMRFLKSVILHIEKLTQFYSFNNRFERRSC